MSAGAHDVSVTVGTLPGDLGNDDLVLLGWPVEHSCSPAMHDATAAHLGLHLRYRTLAVAPVQLDVYGPETPFLAAARAAGAQAHGGLGMLVHQAAAAAAFSRWAGVEAPVGVMRDALAV